MAASSVAAFWVVSFLLVMVPGADWAYAITAGLRDRSVLPAVSGLMLGCAGLTVVVAAGVAALVAQTPAVLTVLTVLGAAYLVWLGAATLAKPATAGAGAGVLATANWATVLKGLLLFLALLPQFTQPHHSWPLAGQITVLGTVHMLNCGIVYLGVGMLARTILRARPVIGRAITRSSGAVMIVIGVLLLAATLAEVSRRPR